MTIEQAAHSLSTRLAGLPWFTAVGVGVADDKPALFLYVKTLRGVDLATYRDGWEGFKVEVRKMGNLRPHRV